MSVNVDDEFAVGNAESMGLAIREFRSRQRMTQSELADRASLHRSYLSAMESGRSTEAMRNLMSALRALDLEVIIRPKRSTR
jgi:HTH-type transcriptional regulator / antitoxin HipB